MASRQLALPFEERPVFGAGLEALSRSWLERYHSERFGLSLSEVRTSLELSGRRAELTNQGQAVRLTIFGAGDRGRPSGGVQP